MNRCRDCKHWSKEHEAITPDWGRCARATSYDFEPASPGTQAIAYDCECYHAFLETAPDFGCIMWEKK